ncbi:MAG: LysR family transcriptional regulator [Pseudomonadota bacterium]|nr:LysR family transcriptional regulator [Pseudomonadota bacterium]MEE2859690.1 LysR family transcriptional regulator [Pseudomonadota bacterium]
MRSLISQISIHKLEVFCTVAELGSVSRAADRLGIAQPVVSAHLKALGQKFGTPLTVRQGRQVRLTEMGQRVFKWSQDIVSRTRELEREMADSRRGLLGKAVVGASMTIGSYVLPALVTDFHRRFPRGEVSVRVATPQFITEAVHSGDCDFAFTILAPRYETDGLEVQHVLDEHLVLVAPPAMTIPDHPLSARELGDLPYVAAEYGSPRRDMEDALLEDRGIERKRVEIELGHAESLKQAVRCGAGAAFLFRASVREELAAGTLREIRTQTAGLATPVYRICRRGKELSSYQRLLMDDLTDAVCSHPDNPAQDMPQDAALPA